MIISERKGLFIYFPDLLCLPLCIKIILEERLNQILDKVPFLKVKNKHKLLT